MPDSSLKSRLRGTSALSSLAWLNVALHVIGLAFLAVGVRPGSPLVALPERMAYVGRSPWGWSLGWGVWMLCTLVLFAFLATLARRLPGHADWARWGVTLAIAGGMIDLFCDALYIQVLPGVSSPPLFLAIEGMAGAGGLIVANGAYSLATLILTLGLRDRGPLARSAIGLGWGIFGFGMVMVGAGFTGSAQLAALAAGPTIGLFCAWAVVIARCVEHAEDRA